MNPNMIYIYIYIYSKIENPKLKRQYLEKLRKLLTKKEVTKTETLLVSEPYG